METLRESLLTTLFRKKNLLVLNDFLTIRDPKLLKTGDGIKLYLYEYYVYKRCMVHNLADIFPNFAFKSRVDKVISTDTSTLLNLSDNDPKISISIPPTNDLPISFFPKDNILTNSGSLYLFHTKIQPEIVSNLAVRLERI